MHTKLIGANISMATPDDPMSHKARKEKQAAEHCPRGHKLTDANLWLDPKTNDRRCIACAKEACRIATEHGRRMKGLPV